MTVVEAQAELADVGEASVELWPGWVSTVPGVAWRVEVVIEEPIPPASAYKAVR
jgi:hypothetical protein